jgi:hypothetical protein
MVQSVKQCAGCGAQMGARARVCPRCGRGSLFGELLWIAVLGVLLLGIGVLSGLIPLDRVPGIRRIPLVALDSTPNPKVTGAARANPSRRQPRKAKKAESTHQPDTALAYAPCPGSDTEAQRVFGSALHHRGPHTPALTACADVSQKSDTATHADTAATLR